MSTNDFPRPEHFFELTADEEAVYDNVVAGCAKAIRDRYRGENWIEIRLLDVPNAALALIARVERHLRGYFHEYGWWLETANFHKGREANPQTTLEISLSRLQHPLDSKSTIKLNCTVVYPFAAENDNAQ